jgi:hypothetical protein
MSRTRNGIYNDKKKRKEKRALSLIIAMRIEMSKQQREDMGGGRDCEMKHLFSFDRFNFQVKQKENNTISNNYKS